MPDTSKYELEFGLEGNVFQQHRDKQPIEMLSPIRRDVCAIEILI